MPAALPPPTEQPLNRLLSPSASRDEDLMHLRDFDLLPTRWTLVELLHRAGDAWSTEEMPGGGTKEEERGKHTRTTPRVGSKTDDNTDRAKSMGG